MKNLIIILILLIISFVCIGQDTNRQNLLFPVIYSDTNTIIIKEFININDSLENKINELELKNEILRLQIEEQVINLYLDKYITQYKKSYGLIYYLHRPHFRKKFYFYLDN